MDVKASPEPSPADPEQLRAVLLTSVRADPASSRPVAGITGAEAYAALRTAYRRGVVDLAVKDLCAVDPLVIPLGTRFYVPGYGTCLAADTGGLVKGNHVDLGFPEEAGQNPWNPQNLDIYILD